MTGPDDMKPEAALRFLAALAVDEPGPSVLEAMDEFMPPGDGDAFLVGVVTLLNVAGAMLSTVDGVVSPWGFDMVSANGAPMGDVPPEHTWAARFITAAMSGDHASAFDLWFVPAPQEVQERQSRALTQMLLPLLRNAVRAFIATGRELNLAAMTPWAEEVGR